MKKILLLGLLLFSAAFATAPTLAVLAAYGPWPFCEAGFMNVPGCSTVVVGQEQYRILAIPSSAAVTNFGWTLQAVRQLDGAQVNLFGTFDRDPTQNGTMSPPITTGVLLPGYQLNVIERVNLPDDVSRVR
jgi:hypothetical protein